MMRGGCTFLTAVMEVKSGGQTGMTSTTQRGLVPSRQPGCRCCRRQMTAQLSLRKP